MKDQTYLSHPRIDPLKILWHYSYYDGPLNGVALKGDALSWVECCDENFYMSCTKEAAYALLKTLEPLGAALPAPKFVSVSVAGAVSAEFHLSNKSVLVVGPGAATIRPKGSDQARVTKLEELADVLAGDYGPKADLKALGAMILRRVGNPSTDNWYRRFLVRELSVDQAEKERLHHADRSRPVPSYPKNPIIGWFQA